MSDPAQDILNRLKGFKPVAYLLVVVLIVIGIAKFGEAIRDIHSFYSDIRTSFRKKHFPDNELIKEARETARGLATFTIERQRAEPPIDFDNWQGSTRAMIRYASETQNLYARDYAGKVAHLREEFLKRNLKDKNLDQFVEHPTNYIGLRLLAGSLARLAEDLEKKAAAQQGAAADAEQPA